MLLNSEVILSQVKELTTGTASIHLNVGSVRNFEILVPPLSEQEEILRRAEAAFQSIHLIEEEYCKASKLLERLEQIILAKAFRGELVDQDPNDEPACDLLDRIRAEKKDQTLKSKSKKKVK
ncbi:restriction modification system DNA specificity subunit (plasmid) [Leptolyngbya boryana NIES-2135]|jgi:type I restriction enzyme S subunit|uniref:Restriction modification system DNA specificity subunit n=1 Tax=Leptolyngbya boryana NIES-2135 TaxID=1973484 RepID=A0A1Z4JS15_LEPBY|nr:MULTISPECIES: restriction endonuclease subunit S [Leptolyngbya]BAY59529.1 restriction modification system DNA specificity subunit [Leptolyngbya boryana NIES-2135]MBD2377765.1 restriction endonuclease subunit S [Leptolyngbya sp. FACHB-238]MBD2402203.1 restriction endonuclease subunit S [Leptolyngbya sp. FACHB-239]MBD2408696.1 restriction endonuclease subunit S [Leptolyngbya sp. FACHB-402]ULP33757.1 restriction endonuclease subunit S [Leptolyngbya boryana IU 594]